MSPLLYGVLVFFYGNDYFTFFASLHVSVVVLFIYLVTYFPTLFGYCYIRWHWRATWKEIIRGQKILKTCMKIFQWCSENSKRAHHAAKNWNVHTIPRNISAVPHHLKSAAGVPKRMPKFFAARDLKFDFFFFFNRRASVHTAIASGIETRCWREQNTVECRAYLEVSLLNGTDGKQCRDLGWCYTWWLWKLHQSLSI